MPLYRPARRLGKRSLCRWRIPPPYIHRAVRSKLQILTRSGRPAPPRWAREDRPSPTSVTDRLLDWMSGVLASCWLRFADGAVADETLAGVDDRVEI